MKKELADETDKTDEDKKYKLLAINLLFAFTVAISAILLDTDRLSRFIMQTSSPTLKDGMEAVAFLVVWLLYGVVMGSNKKKDFTKFISFYWGIGGSISLTMLLGNFIAIPVFTFILAPTYGLGFFMNVGSSYFYDAMCIILSWSAGAIGYLLALLLNKLHIVE